MNEIKIIERKRLLFLTGKDVYFADRPIDVDECDSVTFIGCKTSRKIAGFKSTPALTAITDLRPDIDCIWEKLDKKSNRQRIKRAEKQGITIHRNQYLKEFYQLNKQFTEKKGFDQFLDFGALSFAEMGKYGTLFTAKYQGEIVGGHLYLEDEKHIRLVISASKRLAVTKEQAAIIGRANRLLHWESIKYAKEKGIVEFDWGGLWPEEDAAKDPLKQNINSFKLSFGGKIESRYTYSKTYSKTYRQFQQTFALVKKGVNFRSV